MTLPPLPDIFGNYTLRGLVEIESPPALSWWPQTVGWQVLALLLSAWLARLAWRRWRAWHADRYRREALRRLADIQGLAAERQLPALATLLKATALQRYPRTKIAPLSGDHWVGWLNAQCREAPFGPSERHLLSRDLYTAKAPNPRELGALIAATGTWIRRHEAPGLA